MRIFIKDRDSEEKDKAQKNVGWTFRDERHQSVAQLTFHEGGRLKEGWFEVKMAPLLRGGGVGDFGPAKRLTFHDLEKSIEGAKERQSRRVLLTCKGKGGQWLVNRPTNAEIRHAINNGRQVMQSWQALYSHPRFAKK